MGIGSETPTVVAGVFACLAPCLERNSNVFNAFGHSFNSYRPSIPKCGQGLYGSLAVQTKKARVLHLDSSIIPGPEIAFTVDE